METYALIVFYLIAGLGIIASIMYVFNPSIGFKRFQNSFGINFERLNTGTDEDIKGTKTFFSYFGSLFLGANYLALFTTWLAFKEHTSLAWWSLTYYPIMFLWHFAITRKEEKGKFGQLLFFVLTTSALTLTSSIAF